MKTNKSTQKKMQLQLKWKKSNTFKSRGEKERYDLYILI